MIAQFVDRLRVPERAAAARAAGDRALCVDIAALSAGATGCSRARGDGLRADDARGHVLHARARPDRRRPAFVARLAARDTFVLPGTMVELPGWFRISLTANDAMIEASIDRFRAARAVPA